jgi:hypothetical protein
MSGEELLRLYVILAGWGLMLLAAIKAFGIRRVLGAIALVALLGVVGAFKTLGAVVRASRY